MFLTACGGGGPTSSGEPEASTTPPAAATATPDPAATPTLSPSPRPSPPPTARPPEPEVALSFGTLFEDDGNGILGYVLLRLSSRGDVEVIEPHAVGRFEIIRDLVPSTTPAPFFSSPSVAWSLWVKEETFGNLSAYVLMRSSDYGGTWEPVAPLPDEIVNLTLDLHVDESTLGAPTAWVVVTGEDAFTCSGPRVWTRRLDVDEAQAETVLGFGAADCWGALERRGEDVELVEHTSDVGGRMLLTNLHRLTGSLFSQAISEEASGNPGYVARAERGWIFGQRRPVLHSSSVDAPWAPLAAAPEDVIAADFREDGSGFACGRGFCSATDDGEREWEDGAIPPELDAAAALYSVASMADGTGWAIYESEFLRGGLLRTDDGGATWDEVPIPLDAGRFRFGPLGRNSHAPDSDPR